MDTRREQADAVMVALLKAAVLMRLPPATIGAVLQTGLEDLYLIRTGGDFLELHMQALERARRFVHLWDRLKAIHKQDSEAACEWMNAPCPGLDGQRPVDALAEREGLDRVASEIGRRYEATKADRPAPR
ncbi:MAG: antitoxin Xre/MbcA/ParS toxin-binding domain-containing protein [Vicinamibacterales bacterium]